MVFHIPIFIAVFTLARRALIHFRFINPVIVRIVSVFHLRLHLRLIVVKEYQLLYIVDEIGNAFILIFELRESLFEVGHGTIVTLFILFIVIDAGTARVTCLECRRFALVTFFAPTLQSLLELKQRPKCSTALQDLNEVETAFFGFKPDPTSLTKGTKLWCDSSGCLVCFGEQVGCMAVHNFPQGEPLFHELCLKDFQALFDLCPLDVIIDLVVNELAHLADLYLLLSHLFFHV